MTAGTPHLPCLSRLMVGAVRRRERRLLHGLRAMDDEPARDRFVLLHYPMFALLLASFGEGPAAEGTPSP